MTALLRNLWDSNNSVPLDPEQAIEAISCSRRRHILTIVDDLDGPHSVGDLAESIAAIECDKDIVEISSHERKRVYVALIQHHLDKLDEFDAIVYDSQSKQLHATDATSGLAELVHHLESICDPVTDE
jgi:hypothetical protein